MSGVSVRCEVEGGGSRGIEEGRDRRRRCSTGDFRRHWECTPQNTIFKVKLEDMRTSKVISSIQTENTAPPSSPDHLSQSSGPSTNDSDTSSSAQRSIQIECARWSDVESNSFNSLARTLQSVCSHPTIIVFKVSGTPHIRL